MHDLREVGDPVVNEMTIFPDAPEVKEVAKLLLELADHPSQVRTTLDPTIGFVVPFWLYESFVATWDLKLGTDTVIREQILAGEDIPVSATVEAATEAPARRKPGRPRKEDK